MDGGKKENMFICIYIYVCTYIYIYIYIYIVRPSADAADPNPERVGDVRGPCASLCDFLLTGVEILPFRFGKAPLKRNLVFVAAPWKVYVGSLCVPRLTSSFR